VEFPRVVEIEGCTDDLELAEIGIFQPLDDDLGVADRSLHHRFEVVVERTRIVDRHRPIGDFGDHRLQKSGRFGGRRLPQQVADVIAERYRAVHAFPLVADGTEFLRQHQLVQREHERDAGNRGTGECLKGGIDRVGGPECGFCPRNEKRHRDETDENDCDDTGRDEPPVGVQQEV
jgi:hypothetical protein